jgi:Ser/Thr protein kinase RdoA (MazF antagonist)
VFRALELGRLDLATAMAARAGADGSLGRLQRLLLHRQRRAEALIRTRAAALGLGTGTVDGATTLAVRWLALGAQGSTAALDADGQRLGFARVESRSLRPIAAQQWTQRAMAFAAATGAAVPAALTDARGADRLDVEDLSVTIAPPLPGEALDGDASVADAGAVGRWLGQLHRLGPQWRGGRPPAGGLRSGVDVWRALVAGADPNGALLDAIGQQQAAQAVRQDPRWPSVVRAAAALARRLEAGLLGAPSALLHGDPGPGNLLLRGAGEHRQVASALDWELADFGPALSDLARAASRLAVWWRRQPEHAPAVRGPVLRALVEGWRATGPAVDPAHLAALPAWMAASRTALDLSVLGLGAAYAPELIEVVVTGLHARLWQGVAGVPAIDEALAPLGIGQTATWAAGSGARPDSQGTPA